MYGAQAFICTRSDFGTLPVSSTNHHISNLPREDCTCVLLRSEESRFLFKKGRPTAAPAEKPWRTHRRDVQYARPTYSILDKQRLRDCGRQLWRQHGIRSRVPLSIEG